MDSVQTQTLSIKGNGGGEAYIDFCDGQLCVSVVIEGKQAREIATTPYREVFTKIKMAAESGKCSLTIGFCTDVSELVEILKSVGYSVTLTTSYRDSVMKIHRIYSIQW